LRCGHRSPQSYSREQQYDIDDEQQDDRGFEHDHPEIGPVLVEKLVEVGQSPELDIDDLVPVAQVEPVGQALVDLRQVPIAKNLVMLQLVVRRPCPRGSREAADLSGDVGGGPDRGRPPVPPVNTRSSVAGSALTLPSSTRMILQAVLLSTTSAASPS
jgi:hypothetical protein